jgi:hypothetical protein
MPLSVGDKSEVGVIDGPLWRPTGMSVLTKISRYIKVSV